MFDLQSNLATHVTFMGLMSSPSHIYAKGKNRRLDKMSAKLPISFKSEIPAYLAVFSIV